MDEQQIRDQIKKLVEEYFQIKQSKKKFVPGDTFIQYSGDVTSSDEINSAVQALLDGRLAAGKKVETFEKEFAAFLDVKNVVTLTSGSVADQFAFLTLTNEHIENPLKPGDEVITCALNFPTAVNSILFNNLKPVFVDADLGKYTMNVDALEEAITDKTKAILAVHIFGNSCNLDRIMEIAKKHNLYVVEDCCDSAGTLYDGKKIGTFGDMGTFSFYPAHQMTTMEGGAISTNSDMYDYILKSIRTWGRAVPCPVHGTDLSQPCNLNHSLNLAGMENYDFFYLYTNRGSNSKITEMQAAFGSEQLKKLDEFNRIRKENFRAIVNSLKPFEDVLILPEAEKKSDPAWYSVPLTIRPESGIKREDVAKMFRDSKIEYRYLFTGNVLRQPAFRNIDCRIHGSLTNADVTTNHSFFVGCYHGITEEVRNYIIHELTDFFERKRSI